MDSIDHECVCFVFNWQRKQPRNRVNAARAQQYKAGAMFAAIFEKVDCAAEIVFEQLAGTAAPIDASKDTWKRRSVDHPVRAWPGARVARVADVGMLDADAKFAQA